MESYTFEPWETYRPGNGQLWITAGIKPNGVRNHIATVWSPDGDFVKIARDSNGKLISAAPDLLVACKALRCALLGWSDNALQIVEATHMADEAIFKAENTKT